MKYDSRYFWDDLLQFIEEKSVIPIIGQELMILDRDGDRVFLYDHLAQRLADHLGLSIDDLKEPININQVVYQYLKQPDANNIQLYRRMRTVFEEEPIPIPDPLKKLAAITHFNLFISTTIDTLMEEALNTVRFDGASKTKSIINTIKDVKDLHCEAKELSSPVVFSLLGRVSSYPDYVITEEDTLEFIHSFQSDSKRPKLLFDELRENHLLVLGCNYPNWLERFFIRMVRKDRLIRHSDKEMLITGRTIRKDKDLFHFLNSRLSAGTEVIEHVDPLNFIDELYEQWTKRFPDRPSAVKPERDTEKDSSEIVPGTIFLSYARQDTEMVLNVKNILEDNGFDVWFDKKDLKPGDHFEQKILRGIEVSALFCPFISSNTQNRDRGFFRREWKYAVNVSQDIATTTSFILPISIDNVQPNNKAVVPESFKDVDWTFVGADGLVPPVFLETCRKWVRTYKKKAAGY